MHIDDERLPGDLTDNTASPFKWLPRVVGLGITKLFLAFARRLSGPE